MVIHTKSLSLLLTETLEVDNPNENVIFCLTNMLKVTLAFSKGSQCMMYSQSVFAPMWQSGGNLKIPDWIMNTFLFSFIATIPNACSQK